MLKRKHLSWLYGLVLMGMASSSQALPSGWVDHGAYISTDFGVDFLDFRYSRGQSWNYLIQNGINYGGKNWTLATADTVDQFWSGLGYELTSVGNSPDIFYDDGSMFYDIASRMGGINYGPYYDAIWAWVDEEWSTTSAFSYVSGYQKAYPNRPDFTPYTFIGGQNTWTKSSSFSFMSGWMVYEADIPEPTIIALMGLGLVGIGFAKKKKA